MDAKEGFINDYYRLGDKDARSNTRMGKPVAGRYPLYSVLILAGQHDLAEAYAAGWKNRTGYDLKKWTDHK